MNAVIDQVSLNTRTLEYKMYVSFLGNQHVYAINHEQAKILVKQGEGVKSEHEDNIFWEMTTHLGK